MEWYELAEVFGILVMLVQSFRSARLEKQNEVAIAALFATLESITMPDLEPLARRVDSFFDVCLDAAKVSGSIEVRVILLEKAVEGWTDDTKPDGDPA